MTTEKPTVFVSFNYKSVQFVNDLEKRAKNKGTIVRYEDGVATWGSFTEFMDKIGEQDLAVLVITDDYLKSKACMYEVTKLMENPEWAKKTMFAILDSNIYGENAKANYIKFWADKYDELSKKISELPESAAGTLRKDLEQIGKIRDIIGDFLSVVADRNNPPVWTVIEKICDKLSIGSKSQFMYTLNDSRRMNMKQITILQLLAMYKCMRTEEISTMSGLDKSEVYYHIGKLADQELIQRKPQLTKYDNGYVYNLYYYYLTENGYTLLKKQHSDIAN